MSDKIPSTWTMKDIDSFYKLFEQWQISYEEKKHQERKEKITKIINGRLGWFIAIAQGVTAIAKNVIDII